MSSLAANYSQFVQEADRLLNLLGSIGNLSAGHQKLVAEIVMLRLFTILENYISLVPKKLASGANYLDGLAPNCTIRASSIVGANSLFQTHSRAKPRYNLSWTKASEIKENVKYVISPTDHYVKSIDAHGSLVDEMRRVRNRIAHNNGQSRTNYQVVVKRFYGANLNHITPGMMLLSNRKGNPNLLETYIRKAKIFAKALVKG